VGPDPARPGSRHGARAARRRRIVSLWCAAVAAVVLRPGESRAQDITTEANWEVSAQVGVVSRATGRGTAQPLPRAGSFITVTGSPSAAVSSWFFGDGAALFNQVAALEGLGAAIVPLDQALRAGVSRRRGGVNLGFTAARWITPRLAVQFQGDYAPTAVVMNERALSSLEHAATSYTDAWARRFDAGLAADGVLSEAFVSGETERGGGHQLFLTAGLKVVVHTKRRLRSYVGGAAGVTHTWNTVPTATLVGGYQFGAALQTGDGVVRVPFIERDEVTVRAVWGNSRRPLGVVHGGFEYYMESRRGFRVDLAVLMSPNRVSTFLDATPAVVVEPSPAAIAGTTTPTIQFSSYPAAVTRSTLTGPSLRDVETFSGDGLETQVKLSVAYFLRFGG
jgi:hypothetical protein